MENDYGAKVDLGFAAQVYAGRYRKTRDMAEVWVRIAHIPEPQSEGRATTTVTTGAGAQLGPRYHFVFCARGTRNIPNATDSC